MYSFSLEAASWGSMLAEQNKRGWRKKLLKRPPRRKKDEGYGDLRKRVLSSVLGKDWSKVEANFVRMVKDSSTGWMASFEVVGRIRDRLVLAGTREIPAQLRFSGQIPAGDFAVRARVSLADVGGNNSIRTLFAQSNERLLGVICHVGYVYISEWRDGKWHNLAKGDAPVEIDTPFDLSVEVGSSIKVLINGKLVAEKSVDASQFREGLFLATNQALVWVEDLQVEPIPAANK